MGLKRLFIFFGGAGSGKTTIAKEFAKSINGAFYDGDDSYTLAMRKEGTKSAKDKQRIMRQLYGELLRITENLAKSSHYVCLTHNFNENKWKELFVKRFKSAVTFVFVKPRSDLHLNMLFVRERPDPANIKRSDDELREVLLNNHIKHSDNKREYPKNYETVLNNYDKKSVKQAFDTLQKYL